MNDTLFKSSASFTMDFAAHLCYADGNDTGKPVFFHG